MPHSRIHLRLLSVLITIVVIGAMTLVTSLITGVASTAFAFGIGLDLALTWGALNFLLNFVPVIGNITGILPPALYAIVQFGGWVMPATVLLGFALLQMIISNFIYPVLQGRGLSMPPVTITVSLLFWGGLWAWPAYCSPCR